MYDLTLGIDEGVFDPAGVSMVERRTDHSEQPIAVPLSILILAVPHHDRRGAVRSI